jgi:3-dehydroquinate dehydratase/shikimate dehydrogenase
MRVASVIAENSTLAHQQILQVAPYADVIELRLDHWQDLTIQDVAALRKAITQPVMFTLRQAAQGGHCQLDEDARLALIWRLAALEPEYIDLEWDTAAEFVNKLSAAYPHIQLIGSYHDFTETPADLTQLFQRIFNPAFTIHKIATFANTICDTLRLLIFLQDTSQQHRLIGMAMGEYGETSRILAPVVGSLFTYGSVDSQSAAAPGQLTLQELTEIYRVHLLNRQTQIYALLGDPISQSPGHRVHNAVFQQLQKNAVYVKLRVAPALLDEAFSLCKQLPFYGFSVTIPHKETIVPLLDELVGTAQAMQIANTIKRENDRYLGFNTDSIGCAVVLQQAGVDLSDCRVLILGAGGSAKAIAHALLEQGADITLCNRTVERAREFAVQHGGRSMSFEELFATSMACRAPMDGLPYDVIINTLPADAFIEQCDSWQLSPARPGKTQIAMDIVLKPLRTRFIEKADAAGWHTITGDALFVAQGERQLQIWFGLSATTVANKMI